MWVNTYCIHTWPDADLLSHELSPDCPCGPAEEITVNKRDEKWFHFVHSSLDNREAGE